MSTFVLYPLLLFVLLNKTRSPSEGLFSSLEQYLLNAERFQFVLVLAVFYVIPRLRIGLGGGFYLQDELFLEKNTKV